MNAPRCAPSRVPRRRPRRTRLRTARLRTRAGSSRRARRAPTRTRRRRRSSAPRAHGGGDGVVVLRLLASEHLDVAAPHAGAVLLQREVHLHGIREDHVRLAGGAPVAAHDQRVHRLEAGEKLQHVRLARVEGEPAQAHYGERFFQHEAASRAAAPSRRRRTRGPSRPPSRGRTPSGSSSPSGPSPGPRARLRGVTRGGHASAQIDRSDASLFQIAIARNQKALRDYRAAARSNGCRGSNAYRESRSKARSTRVTHRRSVVSRATGCARTTGTSASPRVACSSSRDHTRSCETARNRFSRKSNVVQSTLLHKQHLFSKTTAPRATTRDTVARTACLHPPRENSEHHGAGCDDAGASRSRVAGVFFGDARPVLFG